MINRRDVLRALPLLPFASPLIHCLSASAQQPKMTADQRMLYVVFHGLEAFVLGDNNVPDKSEPSEKKGRMFVLLPRVHQHAYGIGRWKEEVVLPPGDYELQGLPTTSQPAKLFARDKNIVVSRKKSNITAIDPGKRRFAGFWMPYPEQVYSLRLCKEGGWIGGTAKYENGLDSVTHLALVQILAYKLPANTPVRFSPEVHWSTDSANPEVLHIWAEPAFGQPVGHGHFLRMVERFQGLDLTLKDAPVKPAEVPIGDLPPGFPGGAEQLVSLSERNGIPLELSGDATLKKTSPSGVLGARPIACGALVIED